MERKFNTTLSSHAFCTLEFNWWAFVARGLLSILFGAIALFMPLITVYAITFVFGIYITTDGVFSLLSGINRAGKGQRWSSLVLAGTLSIVAGLVTIIMLQLSSIGLAAFFWTMLSIWTIFTGIFKIAAAIRLRREIQGEWYFALDGFLSIITGIGIYLLLWSKPFLSMAILGYFIGLYAIASGVILLLLSFKLLKLVNHHYQSDQNELTDII